MEMDRSGDRLNAEDVQLMAGSQLCDHRAALAQTDEPDLLGATQGRRPGLVSVRSGGRASNGPETVPGRIDDTQYGLAQPHLPVAGREDWPARIQLTREPLPAEDAGRQQTMARNLPCGWATHQRSGHTTVTAAIISSTRWPPQAGRLSIRTWRSDAAPTGTAPESWAGSCS